MFQDVFNEKPYLKHIAILIGLSYGFFMLGNGIVSLTNPDEVFYALTAKEMIQHNTWMTPYLFDEPQFEKPIIVYWCLRATFYLGGINPYSARFFPAVFAGIGVIAVYLFCRIGFRNEKKAFLAGLILASSGIYIGLARTVFTDMIFSVFILLSLLSFYWAYSCPNRKGAGIVLFFAFSALAVLSKGLLGFLMPFLTVAIFLAIKKDLKYILSKSFLWGLSVFVAISFPWYILMIKLYGNAFIQEFFYNDHIRRVLEAEHKASDKWYFYPGMMIVGMLPWSVFIPNAVIDLYKNLWKNRDNTHLFLAIWIAVVFIICQIAHSKLVSYIFPLYPALAIVVVTFIYDTVANDKKEKAVLRCFAITAILFAIMLIGLIAAVLPIPGITIPLSSKLPLYILFFLLAILTVTFIIFIRKGRLLASSYVLACFFPVILGVTPLVLPDLEPSMSSEKACAYLSSNYKVDTTVLCSKAFARGVRYYTDKSVAVMALHGKNYFSPHPIPFLDSSQKLTDFLKSQPVTYCVLRDDPMNDLEPFGAEFKIEKLKVLGNACIVKIEPRND
jgi:4-amino-4-deoxy-L-arabinose transferase-like glycosyltransferase